MLPPIAILLNAAVSEHSEASEPTSSPEDWTTYYVDLPEPLRGWTVVDVVFAEVAVKPTSQGEQSTLDRVTAEGRTLSPFLLLARPQTSPEQAVLEFQGDGCWEQAVHQADQDRIRKDRQPLRAYGLLPLGNTSGNPWTDQGGAGRFLVRVRRVPLVPPHGVLVSTSTTIGENRPTVTVTAMAGAVGRHLPGAGAS